MRDDGCHLMSLSSCPMFVRVFAFVACFLSCHSTHNVRTRKEREIGCISVVVSMPLHRNFINVALRLLWEIVGLVPPVITWFSFGLSWDVVLVLFLVMKWRNVRKMIRSSYAVVWSDRCFSAEMVDIFDRDSILARIILCSHFSPTNQRNSSDSCQPTRGA